MTADRRNPTVFISYAWESPELKEWVVKLSSQLRKDGIDVQLDQWHLEPGDHVPSFMESKIRESDYVLLVCTPEYQKRSELRAGGVGYEGNVMTAQALEFGDKKFIPLWRSGDKWSDAAPSWLLGKLYFDFRGFLREPGSDWKASESIAYASLLRHLYGVYANVPPLGRAPDFNNPQPSKQAALETVHEMLYVDRVRLSTYLDRFAAAPSNHGATDFERVEALINALQLRGAVSPTRPREMVQFLRKEKSDQTPRPFVLETMDATKVIFKESAFASVPALSQFAVWVSDPVPETLGQFSKMEFTGMFVYLTEAVWEETVGHHLVYSGCSALQAVANLQSGKPILQPDFSEPLGRSSLQHPVEKLQKLGAIVSPPRRIMSLYKIRYVTDEQAFIRDGVKYRTSDLLGYPVFVGECF